MDQLIGLRETKTIYLDTSLLLEEGMDNHIIITLADVCGAGNGIRAELRAVPRRGDDSDGMDTSDDMGGGADTASNMPAARGVAAGPFRLKTQFRGAGECLEGNGPDSPVHNGAAFMAPCQNASGQLWRAISNGDGTITLRNLNFGDARCLESNWADAPVHDGGASMDTCQNVTGQMWRPTDLGDGYYQLRSVFRGDNECLEGNQEEGEMHSGAAFMNTCSNAQGQRWLFEMQ